MGAVPKAKTLKDAYLACELGPLQGETLESYWVDLFPARSSGALSRLETYLDWRSPGEHSHIAFTGHRGCGKSTELLRLKKRRWDDQFFVVYFEVTELLDPNDVAFSDLFLAIAMKLAISCQEAGVALDQRILSEIDRFTASIISETVNGTDADLAVSAEAEAGGAIPFVAKLKARITSQYKAATSHKETIRRVIERDISRLINDTNRLLDNACTRIGEQRGQDTDILVILDNLDRLPPEVGERLVFQHGDFLKQLRCNVIYTVPVSCMHSPRDISRVFPQNDMLPMIRLYTHELARADLVCAPSAVDALVGVVAARIDIPSVFEGEEPIRRLACESGGCVRHLMQFVRDACQSAAGRSAARISGADAEDAIKRHQFAFERMIPLEHYPKLAEVARTKAVSNDETGRQMLYNLSVLEYNGDRRWNYVHPLVRRIGKFQEALNATQKGTEAATAD